MSGSAANELALVLAVAATVGVARELWGPRQTTEAWRAGAEGEERLGAALDDLEEHGYHVFHDLAIPRSKANIDHVVVGPGGLFVIDAKNYTGSLTWSKGTLWHGRYPITKTLHTLKWEAKRLEQTLGCSPGRAQPTMCIMGAAVPKPLMKVDGVAVVRGCGRVVKEILRAPPISDIAAAARLARRIEESFPAPH